MADNLAFTSRVGANGDMEFVEKSTGLVVFALRPGGVVDTSAATGGLLTPTGVGLDAAKVAHAKYDFAVDGGATGEIIPALTTIIPANAVLYGATINPTTAVLATGGAATVAVGTHAGSAANSILTATSKASLTLDALIAGTVTFAAPVKMSAAGAISITVATNPLTAGVIEIFVHYVVAIAA